MRSRIENALEEGMWRAGRRGEGGLKSQLENAAEQRMGTGEGGREDCNRRLNTPGKTASGDGVGGGRGD